MYVSKEESYSEDRVHIINENYFKSYCTYHDDNNEYEIDNLTSYILYLKLIQQDRIVNCFICVLNKYIHVHN